jgi:hypothetical protein
MYFKSFQSELILKLKDLKYQNTKLYENLKKAMLNFWLLKLNCQK